MFNLALPELMPTLAQAGNNARGWLMPDAHSNHVQYVDWAMDAINFITVFFFVGIIAAMFLLVFKFRRKSPHDRAASQMGHNTALELSWTLPPMVIVVFVFYLGFSGYMKLATIPTDAYEIQGIGQKWMWSFVHPSGRVESRMPDHETILDVPADTNVRIVGTSRDVIHSIFIPDFRVKKDMVPGRYNKLWFRADSQSTPFADDEVPADPAQARAMADEQLAIDIKRDRANQPGKTFSTSVEDEIKALYASAELAKDIKTPMTTEQLTAEVTRQRAAQAGKTFTSSVADEVQTLEAGIKAARAIREAAPRRLRNKAAESGYILYCTEYCGTDHSQMLARVVVHKKGWVALPDPIDFTNPAEAGAKLMQRKGCTGCHQLPGAPPSSVAAPSFAHGIFGKAEPLVGGGTAEVDENYIRESIRLPAAKIVSGFLPIMPVIDVSDQEIEAIIAYLKSIKPEQK